MMKLKIRKPSKRLKTVTICALHDECVSTKGGMMTDWRTLVEDAVHTHDTEPARTGNWERPVPRRRLMPRDRMTMPSIIKALAEIEGHEGTARAMECLAAVGKLLDNDVAESSAHHDLLTAFTDTRRLIAA